VVRAHESRCVVPIARNAITTPSTSATIASTNQRVTSSSFLLLDRRQSTYAANHTNQSTVRTPWTESCGVRKAEVDDRLCALTIARRR